MPRSAVRLLLALALAASAHACDSPGGGTSVLPDVAGDVSLDTAPDACQPISCAQAGAECGQLGDGCGGVLTCGTCAVGTSCGAGGVPNVCGEGECVPATCEGAGAECGSIADGCSAILECGVCVSPEICGGAGVVNQCDTVPCVPLDCAAAGATCGTVGDGCGDVRECGDCPSGQSCGGGGTPNQCGTEACQPKDCAALGAECGPISDGCSAVLDCGGCEGDELCGVQTPNQCGPPPCAPKSCGALGVSCGPTDDGCGATIQCGTCEGDLVCESGSCVADCGGETCGPPWSGTCSGTNGYKVCALDPETGCAEPSLFISCQLGNSCTAGACGGGCAVPELLILADRSSSMEGPVWDYTRATLIEVAEAFQAHVKLGLRAFPGASACAPGAVVPLATDNAQAVAAALVDPSAASSTPIGGALSGLAAVLGDPTQGEHVVLMTDGSETCDDEALVFAAVQELRGRGVTVHTIGLGAGFDQVLLEAVAAAGGGTFKAAPGATSLRNALEGLVAQMTGCPHPGPGLAACVEGECADIVCDSGFHICDGACKADDDISACGESCAVCQAPGGAGEAACIEGACQKVCDPGHHLCGNTCVSNNDVASCGLSCTPCPAVPGGSASCDGTKCSTQCPGGQIACGGQCVDKTCCDELGPGDLVINEIMADPAGEDFNGDGTYSGTQDEWLELLNATGAPLQLEGVKYLNLDCETCDKHTFAAHCLPPGEAVLIFAGGAPAVSIAGTLVLVSDSSLSLNNSGDEVVLVGPDGTTLDKHTYTSLGAQSWVRSPQGIGPFVKHSEAPGSGGAKHSMGRCTNGGTFPLCVAP